MNPGPIIHAHQNYALDVLSEPINNSNYVDFVIVLFSIHDLKYSIKHLIILKKPKIKTHISLDNLAGTSNIIQLQMAMH